MAKAINLFVLCVLFVIVVSVCGYYENNHFIVVNFVNKPVFLCDSSAPLPMLIS